MEDKRYNLQRCISVNGDTQCQGFQGHLGLHHHFRPTELYAWFWKDKCSAKVKAK